MDAYNWSKKKVLDTYKSNWLLTCCRLCTSKVHSTQCDILLCCLKCLPLWGLTSYPTYWGGPHYPDSARKAWMISCRCTYLQVYYALPNFEINNIFVIVDAWTRRWLALFFTFLPLYLYFYNKIFTSLRWEFML